MGNSAANTSSEMITQRKSRVWLVDAGIRLFREQPLGAVAGVITLIIFLVAVFADFIAPYGMNETHVAEALAPPSAAHLLGGDQLGRDLFSRIVYGARISVIAASGSICR